MEAALDRMAAFLKPLCGAPFDCQCLLFDLDNISGNVSLKQVGEKLLAYLKEHPSDLILFYGNHEGNYLGCVIGAADNMVCYTKGMELERMNPDGTDLLDFGVRRKVYSAHAEGLFKIRWGSTVLVVSDIGPADKNRKSGWPEMEEPDMNFKIDMEVLAEEPKERKDLLADAPLVFVGGTGLGSKKNYERLGALAQSAGAELGCTRAAALNGWDSFSRVIGISGQSLRAQVCVAFGVSGAAPFLYGVEQVKTLVAVNRDKEAPIYRMAHAGAVSDCMELIEAMERLLEEVVSKGKGEKGNVI